MDGVLPLLGAGALFLIWGLVRYTTATDKSKFSYSWKEALDPMGWLYGVAILSMQSANAAGSNHLLLAECIACGCAALIFLLSAMTDRGADPKWKPPRSFQLAVGCMIVAVLAAGYNVHAVAKKAAALPAAKGEPR